MKKKNAAQLVTASLPFPDGCSLTGSASLPSVRVEVGVAVVMVFVFGHQQGCSFLVQPSFPDLFIKQVSEAFLQKLLVVPGNRKHFAQLRTGNDTADMILPVTVNDDVGFVGRAEQIVEVPITS